VPRRHETAAPLQDCALKFATAALQRRIHGMKGSSMSTILRLMRREQIMADAIPASPVIHRITHLLPDMSPQILGAHLLPSLFMVR
jgi:hypothetical protein